MHYHETHKIHRSAWLRAAVLGANDGIISTASLLIGVAAAGTSATNLIVVGVAALAAGAMSMAAGEYVSVSSQADIERADLVTEKAALENHFKQEKDELALIYQGRGVTPALSLQVAAQLMAHDALGAHARDELGITEHASAQPLQAALSSAAAFTLGAFLPLAAVVLIIFLQLQAQLTPLLGISSLIFLAALGATAAYVGGAPIKTAVLRVTFWGALAMLITAGIGELFQVVF
jgi:VIT1/CCC1 family predicted Fe2+/Mn2+ transporter